MRILKVTQSYYPYVSAGGPPTKVRAIAERLVRRGHRVTVLTADLGPAPEPQGSRGEVEVIYLPTWAHYRILTLNPGVVSFCRRRLREFDLVHIYGLYDLLGPAVTWFCRRAGIPFVIEPMGMFRPIDRSFRLKRLWHFLFGSRALRDAALVIATSELEQRQLLADHFPAEKVLLRYNGIELEEFQALPPAGTFRSKWGVAPDEPLLLFLGRLIPRKGADFLIEAFAQVFPRSGRLFIAGPEGERGYLRALQEKARSRGVESRVVFPGPLYGDEKKAAYCDADMFVLPSRYENFANTAAEAIACGTPVVVTRECGISALVERRAGLVIPYDREALVRALGELVSNPQLLRQLRAGCKPLAASLSWDAVVPPMEAHYARLAKKQ